MLEYYILLVLCSDILCLLLLPILRLTFWTNKDRFDALLFISTLAIIYKSLVRGDCDVPHPSREHLNFLYFVGTAKLIQRC